MQMVFKSLAMMALLSAAAPAWSQEAQGVATASVMQDNPDGKGQPNAVTCRKPQQQAGSRLMAPPVCLINAQWAQLRRDGEDISPDGARRVASEKERSLRPLPCRSTFNIMGNSKGANMATGLSFSPACF
jgi:Spy/CpxP family protein refolding chaperone